MRFLRLRRRSARGLLRARVFSATLLCSAQLAVAGTVAGSSGAGSEARIILPAHLPAQCILTAATDYHVPSVLILAIVKHESRGESVVSRNKNGSEDVGVAQHNTGSWVPFLARNYGISREDLLMSPCQSMRALAYVLRVEMNSAECGGVDYWCGVGRYHAPNNTSARARYVPQVQAALGRILASGRFEDRPKQSQDARPSAARAPAPVPATFSAQARLHQIAASAPLEGNRVRQIAPTHTDARVAGFGDPQIDMRVEPPVDALTPTAGSQAN